MAGLWALPTATQGQGKRPAAPRPPQPLISGCQMRGDQQPLGTAARPPQLWSGMTGSSPRTGLALVPALRSLPWSLWANTAQPLGKGVVLKSHLPEAGAGGTFLSFFSFPPQRMQSESTRLFKNLNTVF